MQCRYSQIFYEHLKILQGILTEGEGLVLGPGKLMSLIFVDFRRFSVAG
jgi:hypothetical protein